MCIFEINVTTQFNPSGVVTTTSGHIIVCDPRTHSLHVLSEQGDILTCKVMEDMCEDTRFFDTYYNIIVTSHMDSPGSQG
jgi:hypothetical protein